MPDEIQRFLEDTTAQVRPLEKALNLTDWDVAIFKAHADPAAHDLEVIRLLLNAETVQVGAFVAPKGTPGVLCALGELFMPLEGLVDVAAERTRLEKEKVRISAEVDKVLAKLNNPDFVQRVPPAVLEEH